MNRSAADWVNDLKHPDREARRIASLFLGSLKPQDERFVDGLLQTMDWADDGQLFWVIVALGRESAPYAKALPPLRRLMLHKTPSIRQAAMVSLTRIGVVDDGIIESAIELLKSDPEPFVRCYAAKLLAKLAVGRKSAVDALVISLSTSEKWVPIEAAIALKLMRPHSDQTSQRLRAIMNSPDVDPAIKIQLDVAVSEATDAHD